MERLPTPRDSMRNACVSPTPTPRPVPALVTHAEHLRNTLNGAHETAGRIESALDRLIGSEPEKSGSASDSKHSPNCHERDMQAIGDTASELASRLHRIAQRLDTAI